MRRLEVFIKAEQVLKAVVDQISDDQWTMTMPKEATIAFGGDAMTVCEALGHHVYDDAWVPDMLAGHTMDEVGQDAFKGDLLGDEPKAHFAAIAAKACAAADALSDADLKGTVHCSYGDYPVYEYLEHITPSRYLLAYDIATVIGVDPTLPADLVQGVWEQVVPNAEAWRDMGLFGPKVEVPDDAPLQHRLLGLTGRRS